MAQAPQYQQPAPQQPAPQYQQPAQGERVVVVTDEPGCCQLACCAPCAIQTYEGTACCGGHSGGAWVACVIGGCLALVGWPIAGLIYGYCIWTPERRWRNGQPPQVIHQTVVVTEV